MASQILNGSGNVSYTNNTGQNVRVVINYMATSNSTSGGITISWGNSGSATASTAIAFGKNTAFTTGMISDLTNEKFNIINANGLIPFESGPSQHTTQALPPEVMLSQGQTFSAICGAYNIIVIPESG